MTTVADAATLRLRPMTEADCPAVMAVERSAYEFPWSEGTFRDCLRAGYSCWVWARGNAILGYGILTVAAGESHILNICVSPGARRQGLGGRLLRYLLQLAKRRGAEVMLLEVRRSNQPAIELYRSLGFDELGTRRGYYPARRGREDALVLARSIDYTWPPGGTAGRARGAGLSCDGI